MELNDFKNKVFTFAGRTAYVYYPEGKANGRMILKTEYLTAFPTFETAMLKRGYHLIFIEHTTRWGTEEETRIMGEFVKAMAKELSLDERVILVGMSCGGLQAANFAIKYPELSAAIYMDAPVLNILSMVGLGEGEFNAGMWRELVSSYGFSKSTVINFRESPIDHLDKLVKTPVILLYGNADNVVIYEENGKVLEDYYKAHGGKIKVISKSICGHHPHGLTDPTVIIDFIEENI